MCSPKELLVGLLEQVEEAPVELLVSAFLLLLKPLKEGKASYLSNTLFYKACSDVQLTDLLSDRYIHRHAPFYF